MAGLPGKLGPAEDVSRPEDSGIVPGDEDLPNELVGGVSDAHVTSSPAPLNEGNQGQEEPLALVPSVNSHIVVRNQPGTGDCNTQDQAESNEPESDNVPEERVFSQATGEDDNSTRMFVASTISSAKPTPGAIDDLQAQLSEKDYKVQQLEDAVEKLTQEKDELEYNLKQSLDDSQQELQEARESEKAKDLKIQRLTDKVADLERQLTKFKELIAIHSKDPNIRKLTEKVANLGLEVKRLNSTSSQTTNTADDISDSDQSSMDEEVITMKLVPAKDVDQIEAKLQQLLHSKKTVNVQYLKLFLVGPPFVGKTTTRDRLLKIIDNIAKAGKVEDSQSSLLANCNQVLASVNGDEWLCSKDRIEEALLLFGFLKEIVQLKDDDVIVCGSCNSVSTQAPSSTLVGPVQESGGLYNEIADVISRLRSLIIRGDYSKFERMLGSTLMNIHDVGGQPGFLQMLPALIRGPAMYLVCFNMSEELDKPYMIRFSRSKLTITPYESKYSVIATISQILSSIANIQCMVSELDLPEKSELRKQLGKMYEIRPVAALIGTHKDKVVERCGEKVTEINKALNRIIDMFGESDVDFVSKGGNSFFPVDNMNGADSVDIAPIRDSISKLFIRQFKDASLPIKPNWLLLNVILRNEYRIAKITDCLALGNFLQIGRDEVKVCLWYLHHCVGTLMYFPNLEDDWFKNNVICSPQVVFDSISKLILPFLLELHSSSPALQRHKKEWFEKGVFSIRSIEMYCAQFDELEKQDIIPIDKLVELLKFANIVSPIKIEGKEAYFMPAMLECASPEELTQPPKPDANNPEPLFISFSCGYVPTGVFCGMITHLVSMSTKGKILGVKWKLKQKTIKQNCISFLVQHVNVVTLLSHERCYEIRLNRRQDSISLHDLCTHVLSAILYVLKSIYEEITPIISFQCPCPRHVTASQHNQHLCILEGDDNWLQFLCGESEVILREDQKVWIGKSATPGSSVNLDVLKFDSTKEFSFHWTKLDGSRRSSVGELSFRRVKEEDFGHYLCDVKKEGKVVFTTYRTLFRSDDGRTAPARLDGDNEEVSGGAKRKMYSDLEVHSGGGLSVADEEVWKLKEIHESKKLTGDGIKIAVLDTGCFIHHEDFKDKLDQIKVYNFVRDDKKDTKLPDKTAVTFPENHCTAVVGLVFKVAPKATVYIMRIASMKSSETTSLAENLSAALDKLIAMEDERPDIISISFRLLHESSKRTAEMQKRILECEKKIDKLEELGTVCVAAAGNSGAYQQEIPAPARFSKVISVGSINEHGEMSGFSPKARVDVYAPGEKIKAPCLSKECCKDNAPVLETEVEVHPQDNTVLRLIPISVDTSHEKAFSGTSMATPMMAGLIALLFHHVDRLMYTSSKCTSIRRCSQVKELIVSKIQPTTESKILYPNQFFETFTREKLEYLLQ